MITRLRHAALPLINAGAGACVAARHGSVLSVLYAVKTGVGIAALPTAIADAEPTLQRVLGPIPELTRIWRILTLPQLRRVPRVAAFFADECVASAIVEGLIQHGLDVVDAKDICRGDSDERVLALAAAAGRVVITQDWGFGEMAIRRGQAG